MGQTSTYNIYYPSNYNAKADIPSEMEQMANSIESALASIINANNISY